MWKQTACGRVSITASLVLAMVGCGGGGGGGAAGPGGGTPGGATTPEGTPIVTGDGTQISEAAHNAWQAASESFTANEGGTWDETKCQQSVQAFTAAAQQQGGRFAEAYYMAGVSQLRCNHNAEALALFNQALAQNARMCKARVMVGLDHLANNRRDQALSTFQQSIRDDATCTEGYVNLAMLQRENGGAQIAEALSNLRRALAIDAQYLPAFNEMALLYLSQVTEEDRSRLDLAQVVCQQASRINPRYAPIYNTWGLIFMKKDSIIEALRMFEKAQELDPRNFEAAMNFGQITLSFRGYEDAKNAFTRAVELQPRNYDAIIGLGAALRGLNQRDEAKAKYEQARDIDPARPDAYFNLGILYQDYMGGTTEAYNQAIAFYRQFLEKAGNNARYADTVTIVNRRCSDNPRRRRRGQALACQPGRIQLAEQAIAFAAEQAQMTAQMEALQRQQAQQATPAPTPATDADAGAATPAPTPAP